MLDKNRMEQACLVPSDGWEGKRRERGSGKDTGQRGCHATWGNKSNENKGENLSPTQHIVVEVGPKQWRSSAETQ